jgi:hypothetical protein
MDHIEQMYKMLERQESIMRRMQNDLNTIKVELEVIQRTGIISNRTMRTKETMASGGIATFGVALIMGIWEFFNKN